MGCKAVQSGRHLRDLSEERIASLFRRNKGGKRCGEVTNMSCLHFVPRFQYIRVNVTGKFEQTFTASELRLLPDFGSSAIKRARVQFDF